jgi:hypothetical protein
VAKPRYPEILAAKTGTSVFVPVGEDKDYAKLVRNLDAARYQYKSRHAIEFEIEVDPARGGATVAILANPNPQKPEKEVAKKPKQVKGAAGARSSLERAFWRNAFLRAFDVVPNSVLAHDTHAHGAKCAAVADEAIAQYRRFVVRHEAAAALEKAQE